MELTSLLGGLIVASAAALMLSGYKREYSFLIGVAAGAAVFVYLLGIAVNSVFGLRNIVEQAGLNTSYFSVILKSLGICLITGFVSDICRDAGQNALASGAELAGRCAVFIISLPLLEQILSTAAEIIS